MTKRAWWRALVALMSAGWLVPMWLGVKFVLDFVYLEAWPLWAGESPLNSFPFIGAAGDCFLLAFVWLGLVIFGWAWVGVGALRRAQG